MCQAVFVLLLWIIAGAMLLMHPVLLMHPAGRFARRRKLLVPLRLFRRFREFTVLLVVGFVAGLIFYAIYSLFAQSTDHISQLTSYILPNDGIKVGSISSPSTFGQLMGSAVMPASL